MKKLTKKEIAEQTGPGRKSLTKTIQKESEEKNLVDELADLETQLDELKNKVLEVTH